LRYEEDAARPRETVVAVADVTGLGRTDSLFEDEARIMLAWQSQRLFPPADETVLAERKHNVVIRPAETWKAPENRWLHRTARVGTWPIGQRLYPDPA